MPGGYRSSRRSDPFPYPLLSSITSLEAVLLAAFVLMKQNRLEMVADRRDHLDLQVNLLTEQRATQIIQISIDSARTWASLNIKTRLAAS